MEQTENKEPRPINEFDMKEIYRLVRNERIPGFVMLGREREYLDEYRQAMMREANMREAEMRNEYAGETQVVEAENKTEGKSTKKRKNSRKKKNTQQETNES